MKRHLFNDKNYAAIFNSLSPNPVLFLNL